MNSLQRILAALRHEPVDRIPVTAFCTAVTLELMEKRGFDPESPSQSHAICREHNPLRSGYTNSHARNTGDCVPYEKNAGIKTGGKPMTNLGACGCNCDICKFHIDNTCGGCSATKGKPFYSKAGETCDWYKCAHSKSISHCCCCNVFPCNEMKQALINEGEEAGAAEALNNLKELHKTHVL